MPFSTALKTRRNGVVGCCRSDRPILSVRLQDETQHSSLLLHLKQECDRPIES
ncbi:hypothetical protein [Coleofasciculus chthonoplastes]|uniref:hypothetical protein n=1 Tax=Coleofasciculus TaxID=669368 RepID=UPI0032F1C133